MKSSTSTLITTATILLFATLVIPADLVGQHTRYKLIDIGTFGGPQSYFNDGNSGNNAVALLNNHGIAAGWADTATPDPFPTFCFNEDCYVSHAFQSHKGVKTDLGALSNGVSSLATWISANGLIAGFSQNGEIDPLISGLPETHGVLWRNRSMTDLGTLEGGYESQANAVNRRGQVVGWSLNLIPDANSLNCPGFCTTETRAFLWEDGEMQDLGTLGGTDALAQFINDRGQVVGLSYTSSAPNTSCPFAYPLATGSFIWQKDTGMTNLGTLGGTCVVPTGVNNHGVVVGDNVNDSQIQRAFVWKDGSIQDLGGTLGGNGAGAEGINDHGVTAGFATLAGETDYHATIWRQVGELTDLGVVGQDPCSFASFINSKTQVVGASLPSCNFDNNTRAFLWEDGSIHDLNTLIAPGASLHLQWAEGINDRGEIAGSALDVNGHLHAFLLIPCVSNGPSDCQEVIAGTKAATQSFPGFTSKQLSSNQNSIRQMLRRRLVPGPHILTPTRAVSGTESTPGTEAGTSLRITSFSPPSGRVGRLYDLRCNQIPPCNVLLAGFPVAAAGGLQPYSWSWTGQQGSSLPPGLIFPDTSGYECLNIRPPAICGKPTTAGSYTVVMTVMDSESPPSHASARYTIHIFP